MRKLLLLFIGFFFATFIYAQTSDEEAQAIVNLLGVQKKEVIAKLVVIPAKDSTNFWKLYDEYQKKIIPVAKSRIHLYEKTAMSYSNMTPKIADSLAKKYFENRMTQEKTLEEYYQKIKTAVNAVTAFEFYQAEVYITTQVRSYIMQQIPTYSEFKMVTQKK